MNQTDKNTHESVEQQSDESHAKDLATKVGEVCGNIIGVCLVAVIVALTAKFIVWLF